ncbi:M4 family metallopeptidase [Clostridium oceanicum]|uniref:Thermolysin n=1 Tax=Clostridium oceanicum TaxID=1543 RepID=A0ABN1JF18_9CLOT
MLKKKLAIVMLTAFITSTVGSTCVMAKENSSSDEKQDKVLNNLQSNTKNSTKFDLKWDKESDAPRFISGDLSDEKVLQENTALKFSNEIKDVFKIEKGKFKILKTEKDELGKTHYRMVLTVDGIPVYGDNIIVHTDKKGKVYSVNGKVKTKVKKDNWKEKFKITKEKAISLAEQCEGLKKESTVYLEKPTSKTYLYEHDGKVQPVYLIKLFTVKPAIHKLSVFVNAENGKILDKYDETETLGQAVKGKGIDLSNKETQINTYFENGKYYLKDTTRKSGAKVITADLNHINDYSIPGKVITDDDNNFDGESQKSAVSAHINIGRVYDYYNKELGRDSIDGKGMDLRGCVHLGNKVNNAFWTGSQMVFGDGDGVEFSPLSESLDVVGHELTHGVTQYTSNLAYQGQSGALNEAMSDIMGLACESYFYGNDKQSWLIGDEVYTPGKDGDGLRDMSDPKKNGNPDHMRDYLYTRYDHGGVHTNSGIIEKAAYNIGKVVGKRKLGKLFYRANTNYLVSLSDFEDAREAVIKSAEDLYGKDSNEYKLVMNGFSEVGIGDPYKGNPVNDKFEPNNSISSAVGLEEKGIYTAAISNSRDKDWFYIDAKSKGTLLFALDKLPEDYDMYLYDGSGRLIDKSYNYATSREQIVHQINSAGRYYLLVTSKYGIYDAYKPYQLAVAFPKEETGDKPKTEMKKGWNLENKTIEVDNKNNKEVVVEKEGVSGVGVYFDNINLDRNSKLCILDENGKVLKEYTGNIGSTSFSTHGHKIKIVVKTSNSNAKYNYKIYKVAYYVK